MSNEASHLILQQMFEEAFAEHQAEKPTHAETLIQQFTVLAKLSLLKAQYDEQFMKRLKDKQMQIFYKLAPKYDHSLYGLKQLQTLWQQLKFHIYSLEDFSLTSFLKKCSVDVIKQWLRALANPDELSSIIDEQIQSTLVSVLAQEKWLSNQIAAKNTWSNWFSSLCYETYDFAIGNSLILPLGKALEVASRIGVDISSTPEGIAENITTAAKYTGYGLGAFCSATAGSCALTKLAATGMSIRLQQTAREQCINNDTAKSTTDEESLLLQLEPINLYRLLSLGFAVCELVYLWNPQPVFSLLVGMAGSFCFTQFYELYQQLKTVPTANATKQDDLLVAAITGNQFAQMLFTLVMININNSRLCHSAESTIALFLALQGKKLTASKCIPASIHWQFWRSRLSPVGVTARGENPSTLTLKTYLCALQMKYPSFVISPSPQILFCDTQSTTARVSAEFALPMP